MSGDVNDELAEWRPTVDFADSTNVSAIQRMLHFCNNNASLNGTSLTAWDVQASSSRSLGILCGANTMVSHLTSNSEKSHSEQMEHLYRRKNLVATYSAAKLLPPESSAFIR